MTDTLVAEHDDCRPCTLPWRLRRLLSIGSGALLPLSMAPLDIWPLALTCPALFAWLLFRQRRREVLRLSFAFGLGLFGVGASWVYVSIHDFGNASMALAALLTSLFVVLLAAIFSLPFALLQGHLLPARWRPATAPGSRDGWLLQAHTPGLYLLAFSGLWILGEWLRSWLFTGFPWLLLGYSQLDTPLAGWAAVGGIFAVSLVTLASAACLCATLLCKRRGQRLLALVLVLAIWLGGAALKPISWTQADGPPLQVALVQPNIPQEQKWQPDFIQPSLERLVALSAAGWGADWVIWPEAAIPLLYHRGLPFLEEMQRQALASNSALITGILYDDYQRGVYHNSLVGVGLASGIYHKTRLVPFGEYVPLEHWLRGLIDFFNLPMSVIHAGRGEQFGLQAGSHRLAAAICYEIVYPDLVARGTRGRAAIITVSNDAWFGRSWGPLQHLQMARLRALETGRYVVRATNNGVSAIIAADGTVTVRSEQFIQTTVLGEVEPRRGDTPFMQFGSGPAIAVSALLAVAGLGAGSWRRRAH